LTNLCSAGVLYFIFFAGDFIAGKLLASAQEEIIDIYRFKGNVSLIRITILMFLIIGPGEELLWRGFAQRLLSQRYGPVPGFFLAAGLYTLIHVASGNPMLILAAFVCGVYWGWIYMRGGSLILNIVSHIVWDISVFVVFPFKG
jgi:membrane protease YdiL (CAAX protease family)